MKEALKPEITLLYCGSGLAEGEYLPEGAKKYDGCKVRYVMMPCSCKVEAGYILKLFEEGADGVMVVVCPKEECRFINGSSRTENRIRYVQSLLEEVGLSRDRLAYVEGKNFAADNYFAMAMSLATVVNNVGPNPIGPVLQAV